jgi:formylglycine-generating enzyme required for sulfatase activity/predicted Ser/Thr protein kinase
MERIGKYSIQSEIGKGGMGVVYRGLDPYIGRTVAIKTIRLDVLRQEGSRDEALRRFLREAQAAGNLSHPNIVTIYDVGEHEGMIYIAMEFVQGQSLETLLQQGRAFTLAEVVRLFGQIASALDYAHGKGIVHRDIKPANILVGEDLRVSIVDFGIARTATSTMTQAGILLGTPRYMSPEQIAGRQVDSRCDIFALGAILYELLTRHNPFEGESITTVIYKIMHTEPEPLRSFNDRLPPGLEAVVRKALARDPEARYRTCGELQAELQACVSAPARGETLKETFSPAERTELLDTGGITAFSTRRRGRRRLFLLLAALACVAAAVYFLVGIRGRGRFPALPAGAAVGGGTQAAATGPAAENKAPAEAPAASGSVKESAGPAGTPAVAAGKPGPEAVAKLPPPAPGDQARAAAETVAAVAGEEKALPAPATATNRRGFLEGVFFNDTVMVLIPQSYFTLGSPAGQGEADEHPAHRVFIGDFWLGKTEVTFAQYDAFCRATGHRLPGDEGWGRGSRPVINVSWMDADAYCRWLTLCSGRNFRLPSEAEWEKAARELYPWGKAPPGPSLVNMKGSADGFAFTAPVGSFPAGASPYGILDMAGNVWEWMGDWYDAGYYKVSPGRDPRGPAPGSLRSVRGGSWANGVELIRSGNRSSDRPDATLNVLGFRVAMDSR